MDPLSSTQFAATSGPGGTEAHGAKDIVLWLLVGAMGMLWFRGMGWVK